MQSLIIFDTQLQIALFHFLVRVFKKRRED